MNEGNKNPQSGLMMAIVFSALIIGGSLVYLGSQMTSDGISETEITALLEGLDKGNAPTAPAAKDNTITVDYDKLVDDDAVLGDKDAPITLVEFSDYQCPFCRRHFTSTVPSLIKNYVDSGKLKIVYRDYPLAFHNDAIPAAMATECARDQKDDDMYYKMHDMIYEEQAKLGTGTVAIPVDNLFTYAANLGLNESTFKECMDSEKFKSEISADLAAGSSFGVSGTPGFVITDGKTSKLISGAQPYSVFKAEIDALLN